MRGSTPLDVAASSVMDNNELALGLEEPDLEKVSWLWGGTVLALSCVQRSQAKQVQTKGGSIRTSFALSEKGWNVSSWQCMIGAERLPWAEIADLVGMVCGHLCT